MPPIAGPVPQIDIYRRPGNGLSTFGYGRAPGTMAVPGARSQEMVDKLKSAEAKNVRFSNYTGVGHHSWLNAFAEPELFEWLFDQRKS